MDSLQDILKRCWGYTAFRPMQREAMDCAVAGRDSLVVLPTGGGKSLCFQAPAVAMDGMAVVVSPLLSLMKDQVDALRTNGIGAAKIDSSMTEPERREVYQSIQHRELKLLYVSPERLVQPKFINYLQSAGVSFLVVDEAHCISQWGHDFRPEYRELRCLRQAFPGKTIHAFTATAAQHVRDDIVGELALQDPEILVGSFDRPNLVFHVERRADVLTQVCRVIDAHSGDPGIVYCIRRAEVEGLCAKLVRKGYKAQPYHAGMDAAARKRNQDAFSNDRADIIVATVAFGMGIDKSNVRYVVHAAMPKSIEHYHQETGRAGRDGLPADCWLFYSYRDYRIWENIVTKGEANGAEIAVAKLEDMRRYSEQAVCRHKALVSYFGQDYPGRACGACDVCLGPTENAEDLREIVQAIFLCVIELGAIAGPSYTTLVLTGSREERVLAKGHQSLKSFAALARFNAREVRDWIEQLVQQDCLAKTGEYNILSLTPKAGEVLREETSPFLTIRAQKPPAPPKPAPRLPSQEYLHAPGDDSAAPQEPSVIDRDLFELLRRVRRSKAEELGVPPFVVFGDAVLREMARHKPRDKAGFLSLHGVGQKKCEAFGDDFLAVIRAHCENGEEQ